MFQNKKNTRTIEQKTAETILQTATSVVVGGHKYRTPKPTLGTLVKVSEEVSKLPQIDKSSKNVMHECLRIAKDSEGLAYLVANLVVGSHGMHGWFLQRWIRSWRIKKATVRLLDDTTNADMMKITMNILAGMQVGDFFGLIAFLGEVNLTKATKTTETTQSGQVSEASPSGTE